jgi:hypothetical protein
LPNFRNNQTIARGSNTRPWRAQARSAIAWRSTRPPEASRASQCFPVFPSGSQQGTCIFNGCHTSSYASAYTCSSSSSSNSSSSSSSKLFERQIVDHACGVSHSHTTLVSTSFNLSYDLGRGAARGCREAHASMVGAWSQHPHIISTLISTLHQHRFTMLAVMYMADHGNMVCMPYYMLYIIYHDVMHACRLEHSLVDPHSIYVRFETDSNPPPRGLHVFLEDIYRMGGFFGKAIASLINPTSCMTALTALMLYAQRYICMCMRIAGEYCSGAHLRCASTFHTSSLRWLASDANHRGVSKCVAS